jgi:predicted glutamine amidotransferase
MLNRLDAAFPRGYPKDRRLLWRTVAAVGHDIGVRGTFNFLLGDGAHLFARCATKLCYIIRKSPFRTATLADDDLSVDFSAVTTPRDRVAIIATAPLTRDETWTLGRPGEMWVFRAGKLAATLPS